LGWKPQGIGIQFTVGTRDFSRLHNSQTCSETIDVYLLFASKLHLFSGLKVRYTITEEVMGNVHDM
jgi:hypothetical protein